MELLWSCTLHAEVETLTHVPTQGHAERNCRLLSRPSHGAWLTLCRCQDGEAPVPSCPTVSFARSPRELQVKENVSTAPRPKDLGVLCISSRGHGQFKLLVVGELAGC
jgi:hypothetical protein